MARAQLSRLWARFGALPAVPMAIGVVVVGGAASLVGGSVVPWLGLVVVAVYIAYCIARPRGGWDVFWPFLFPGPTSQIAHDAFGWPRAAVSVPLLALSLVMIWANERDLDRSQLSSADGR